VVVGREVRSTSTILVDMVHFEAKASVNAWRKVGLPVEVVLKAGIPQAERRITV
jgi:hypothetical protein